MTDQSGTSIRSRDRTPRSHWSRFVGQAAATIAQKMVLDQFLISPPILATFYLLMSLMERREDVFQEMR